MEQYHSITQKKNLQNNTADTINRLPYNPPILCRKTPVHSLFLFFYFILKFCQNVQPFIHAGAKLHYRRRPVCSDIRNRRLPSLISNLLVGVYIQKSFHFREGKMNFVITGSRLFPSDQPGNKIYLWIIPFLIIALQQTEGNSKQCPYHE